MKKRLLASLLSMLLVFSLIPTVAFATGTEGETVEITEETETEEDIKEASDEGAGDEAEEEPEEESEAEKVFLTMSAMSVGDADSDEEESDDTVTAEAVQALIDALPDADEITAENTEEVEAALDAIDTARSALYQAGGNPDELDYTKYNAACEALAALEGEESGEPVTTVAEDGATAQADGHVASVTTDATTYYYYTTLSAAISAATSGAAITLLSDINLTSALTDITTNITLDFNGHTLSGSVDGTSKGLLNVGASGSLTIKDSGTGGTINNTGRNGIGVCLRGTSASLTVEGGTISGTKYGIFATSSATNASITVSGGNISGQYGMEIVGNNTTVTITDGTISGANSGIYVSGTAKKATGIKLIVSGGTISGDTYGIYFGSYGGSVEVSDGTITGGNSGMRLAGGQLDSTSPSFTISGGTISGGTGIYMTSTSSSSEIPATLTITGGTITGTTSDGIYAQGNYSQVIIYDGIVSGETNGVRINGGQELLEISGGTFSGKDDSVIVSNSYASGAITGGTFNTDVGEYLKNSDGTESGSTYVLLANSDGTYTAMTETNAKTVAGTYVIYTDDENEEYTIYYDSVSSVSDVEVKVAGYSVEYDGEEHTITVTVTSPADAVVTYSTDGTTYSSTLPTYTNAGTYTIYYKIKSSNGTVYGSETVTISVKALSENDFTVDTEDEAYTGSAITKTITSDLVENADYTVSHADNTVAGTATITITGIGNCSGTLTYTFTINKKSVTPSISGMTSKTYDGTTDVTDEQGISIALDGVAVGDDVSATASFAYDSAAVSTDKTITATGIILSGEDAGNYDLSSAIATTTGSITQKALSQSDFTVDTDGVTYTGSAITKGITSDLVKDTDYTVTYNDNINAGTATITITGKGNYSGTLTYNFTINSKSVTASISGDTKKTYDGTTDVTAAQGLSITLDGVADGDNVTASASYTYNSVDAEEGKTITASGITLTGDDVGNYTLSNTTATTGGSITTRTLGESDFTVDTTAETYTGFAITKAVSSTGSLVEGTDYTISYSSDNTNAGTVTITLTGSGNCTGTLTYNFTINKATPTVSLTGVESKNYNGTAVSDPTVSVTLVGSEEYSGTPTVTYYSVADDGTETALSSAPVDVGNYKVVVEVDAGRNYTTATAEAAFSIFAAEQDVTIEGFTDVVYDGQTHEVTVTTDADATVTVTYTDADGNTVAAPVNAGTYTAHVTVTRDNYATVEEDVTVSIAQAAQSISYDTTSVTKTVGDDAFTNKLTQTTVYGTITYTSSDISVAAVDSYGQVTIVGAGTAIITATVSGSDNYASATASYTLTVSEDSDNSSTENDISSNDSSSSTSDGSNSDSSSTNSTSNPETGDTTNIALWVVIMLLAASGITVTTIYGRKRRYNK